MAQHFQDACPPFQYALSTRAGTECLARLLRAATEADHKATVLFVDGVGAFDHVSRASLRRTSASLRFCRACGNSMARPHNTCGRTTTARHIVEQGEGGEQATQAMLLPGEVLFAFLNDISILCRARAIFDILQARLQAHANLGKTRAWNAGGLLPPGVDACRRFRDRRRPQLGRRPALATPPARLGCPRVPSRQPRVHTGAPGREARVPGNTPAAYPCRAAPAFLAPSTQRPLQDKGDKADETQRPRPPPNFFITQGRGLLDAVSAP